jgi:hypothetical protein
VIPTGAFHPFADKYVRGKVTTFVPLVTVVVSTLEKIGEFLMVKVDPAPAPEALFTIVVPELSLKSK